ncbi:hypothetical protein [Mycobacteroides immunogenum]|nr:hypothetical protein [Mycobacteroides immunogenum]
MSNRYKDVELERYNDYDRDCIVYWSPFEGVFVRDFRYWESEVIE